jgi:hypothetical protein
MDKTENNATSSAFSVEDLVQQLDAERATNEARDNATHARMEADMIGIVNANSANRKARERKAAMARAYDKQLNESYSRACRKNAIALVSSVVLSGCTIVLGHTGIISPDLATALAAVFLPLTGCAAHDCKILFQFAGSIRG